MTAECPRCGAPAVSGKGCNNLCSDCHSNQTARKSDGNWQGVDFTTTESDTYPPELLKREQWMGRKGKLPFAPWANRDEAVECTNPDHDDDTVDKCDCDARWKWGYAGNYVDGQTVALAEDDPRLDGRVFLRREEDPYAFVDGDDVRDPVTGDVHPGFRRVLTRLGITYADVSTSGSGVHAYYKGVLPDGMGKTVFELDSELRGTNDDPPTVEIYANKHVNVATGEHITGTPVSVAEWDSDALSALLAEHDALKDDPEPVDHDTDRDLGLDDHDPSATTREEVTTDARDIAHAVDELRPADLPLATSPVGEDGTGWEK